MKKSIKVLAALSVVAAGGVAFAPLTSYAATGNATITVSVNETLSMTVNGQAFPITSTVTIANNTLDDTTVAHAINVATNNPLGYTLTVQDADTSNALQGPGTNTIPAVTGTTITATTPAWGYRVQAPGESSPETDYHAVPTSDATAATLRTISSVSSSSFNETTTVKYGFATGSVPSGDYTDEIVYTATGHVAS